jgi:hypothetical protein
MHILAQATVIYYCKTMAETAPPSSIQATYEPKALEACSHLISLAETLPELPSSKVINCTTKREFLLFLTVFFAAPPFNAHALISLRRVPLRQDGKRWIRTNSHPKAIWDLLRAKNCQRP